MKLRKFRRRQEEFFLAVTRDLRSGRRVLIIVFTGGGKTLLGLAIGSDVLRTEHFDKVVITTYSEITRDQFTDYGGIKATGKDGLKVPILDVKPLLGRDELLRFIQEGSSGTDKIGVTTNANFLNCLKQSQNLLSDTHIQRTLFINDERHLISEDPDANQISALFQNLVKRGALAVGMSAYPVRADGKLVWDTEGGAVYHATLTEAMICGEAPRKLGFRVIPVSGEVVVETGFLNYPENREETFQKLIEHYEEAGRPFAVVRIKPMNGNDVNGEWTNTRNVEELKAMFEARGISVLDATSSAKAFRRAMSEETKLLYSKDPRSLDGIKKVILTFHRATMGLDSPVRSVLYFLGLPMSMGVFVQGTGRTMRERRYLAAKGYSSRWIDRSEVVLLMANVNNADGKHYEMFFNISLAMGSWQNAEMLAEVLRIDDGIHSGHKVASKIATELESSIAEAIRGYDLYVRTQWTATRSPLGIAIGESLKMQDRVDWIHDLMQDEFPQVPKDQIKQILSYEIARQNPKAKARFQELWRKASIFDHEDMSDAFRQAALTVFDEFCQEATDEHDPLRLQLTGEQLNGWPKRLEELMRIKNKPSSEEILRRVLFFLKRNERLPELSDVDPESGDEALAFRQYNEIVGDLGKFVCANYVELARGTKDEEFSQLPWNERVSMMHRGIARTSDPKASNRLKSLAGKGEGRGRYKNQKLGLTRVPEAVYFSSMCLFFEEFPGLLSLVTFEEAIRMSRESNAARIRELLDRAGPEAVVQQFRQIEEAPRPQ